MDQVNNWRTFGASPKLLGPSSPAFTGSSASFSLTEEFSDPLLTSSSELADTLGDAGSLPWKATLEVIRFSREVDDEPVQPLLQPWGHLRAVVM